MTSIKETFMIFVLHILASLKILNDSIFQSKVVVH